ncbi:MAG: hypothetical protein ACKVHO_08960 [Verrucomicrobiia bacterium]|jgi:hypothetical protein
MNEGDCLAGRFVVDEPLGMDGCFFANERPTMPDSAQLGPFAL